MKQLKFKSIRTHLTYWFLVLSLIPLIAALVITYYQRVNVIEISTFDKLTAIRDLKVERVNDWLTERMGDISVLSKDNELKDLELLLHKTFYNQNDHEILNYSRQILNRFLKNYQDYYEFFVINPKNGRILVSTKKYMEGEDKSLDEYFTKPMQTHELSIKDIYFSSALSEYTMTYSIPIFSRGKIDGDIVGILVARINLHNSLFKMLLERVGLGETGETLIVNKEVVALNELRWYENAPLNLQISAEPAVKSAQGETGIAITTDYRDESILAAYTYIPQMKWGFVCKQDMKELNAPIREMVSNFIVIFLISSIGISLIAFKICKSISKPIVEMNRVAQKLKKGDYSVRNSISSENELGSLAMEFNNMAEMTESKIKIQQGIAYITETMIGKSSLHEFGVSLLKRLMKITEANMSTFYILNEGSMEYEHFASIGANQEMLSSFSATNPQGEFGNALSTKNIFHLQNIPKNTIFKFKTIAGDAIPKEIFTIPILIENNIVAVISLVNIQTFSKDISYVLKQSWSSINTSYSNLIANERTRVLAEHLSRINQQLEAQTEELQEQSEELKSQTKELQYTTDELQEQNMELEARRNQVESANKLKSEFLSNMSHELRTPLNSIMALSRVLIMQASGKLNEEENNYLEIVERNGKHLLSLINSILDLSKIEAGKMDVFPKPISITSLLQLVKENMQTLSENKGISLTLNVADNLPKVETDESRLHQVLVNIVGNAIKFTEKGGVDISVKHNSENMFIEVRDSGIGISDEILPYVFEEFRQADGTSSRQYEGTGLGLAIASKMMKILGGEIKAKSKLGEGSVFTITIPVKWHEEILPVDIIKIGSKLPKSIVEKDFANVTKTRKIFSKSRILMVEDKPEAIIQVKTVLEKENYTVDVAGGGQEALDYVQHTIPDGIILDLMMPKVDGFEVLENLRSTEETKNVPVLILTAKDLTREDLAKLSANNVQQLIHKGDVDIKGLLLKVKLMFGSELAIKVATPASSKKSKKPKVKNKFQKINKKNALPTILVVEDNLDNMTTIKAILGNTYTVIEANDGKEGLDFAQSQSLDLILLDMSLPKISGEDIISLLRNNDSTKLIPVIAVTAQAMRGDKEKFMDIGCDGYVSKPIDQGLLLAKIEKLLSRKVKS